ncbi:hypothetical protein A2974_00030 [Candidatus Peregrinibacteria bacterium RIFCSPLOWO2_01_FULL_48_20]|nr:MAG: hypothetical protein A2974_00030 [Candidatus Peregrinibacteria bacterium RIFCSPLOWO2_01_FULL_48_20]
MASLFFKVDEKIVKELDLIKEQEGLGNRTAVFTFLVKSYFLNKKGSLKDSINLLKTLLDRVDVSKLPSAEEQLKDL